MLLHVMQMVDHMRVQIIDNTYTRRRMAEKWVTVLCPKSQKILNLNMSESFTLHVIIAGDDVYKVFDWRLVAIRPTPHSCSCREWNVTCILCKHACVIWKSPRGG